MRREDDNVANNNNNDEAMDIMDVLSLTRLCWAHDDDIMVDSKDDRLILLFNYWRDAIFVLLSAGPLQLN